MFRPRDYWEVNREERHYCALFDRPVFQVSDFIARSGIPRGSAHRLVRQLKQEGVIHGLRPQRGRSAAIIAFPELLQITEE